MGVAGLLLSLNSILFIHVDKCYACSGYANEEKHSPTASFFSHLFDSIFIDLRTLRAEGRFYRTVDLQKAF